MKNWTNVFRLIILPVIIVLHSSCMKNDNPLEETKWRLVGLVDNHTGALIREYEPKDCEECYTLTFEKDYVAKSQWINTIHEYDLGFQLHPPKGHTYGCLKMLFCENYEKDGNCYWDVTDYSCELYMIHTYKATQNELKLFSSKTTNYLLYKRIDK